MILIIRVKGIMSLIIEFYLVITVIITMRVLIIRTMLEMITMVILMILVKGL